MAHSHTLLITLPLAKSRLHNLQIITISPSVILRLGAVPQHDTTKVTHTRADRALDHARHISRLEIPLARASLTRGRANIQLGSLAATVLFPLKSFDHALNESIKPGCPISHPAMALL